MSNPWPEPKGGWKPVSRIGKPLSDSEIIGMGYESTPMGWKPFRDKPEKTKPSEQQALPRITGTDNPPAQTSNPAVKTIQSRAKKASRTVAKPAPGQGRQGRAPRTSRGSR